MNNTLHITITQELDLSLMVRNSDDNAIYKNYIPAVNIPGDEKEYTSDPDIVDCINKLKKLITRYDNKYSMIATSNGTPINSIYRSDHASRSLRLANYIIRTLFPEKQSYNNEEILMRLDKIHSIEKVSTYSTIRKMVYSIAEHPEMEVKDSEYRFIGDFKYVYSAKMYARDKNRYYKYNWNKVLSIEIGGIIITIFDAKDQEHIFALIEGPEVKIGQLTVTNVVYLLKGLQMRLENKNKEGKKMIISTKNEAAEKYMEYIETHIEKVRKGFDKYGKELCRVCGANYDGVQRNIGMHDLSKMSREEFDAYLDKFYPYRDCKKSDVERRFNIAWLHHIHNNPHHPEHWILTGVDSGVDEVFEMPAEYIVEMILDWDTFKKEDGTGGAYDYYFKDGHRKEGLLHPRTREILEKALQVVK